eukprot:g3372.t1
MTSATTYMLRTTAALILLSFVVKAQNECLNTTTNTTLPQGTVCRAALSSCDVEEVCDGVSTECPADNFAPNTTVCRAATSSCDVKEVCDGVSAECPVDTFAPSTTVCRAAVSSCDVEEVCDGVSAECPSDAIESNTTVCRAAVSICDVEEVCDGVSTECPSDVVGISGIVCRAPVSICDVEEVCDGASAECPSDTFAPNTTVCRAAVSICDVEEVCDGASAECPSDAFAPSTTVCRAAVSICDNEEVCDGASAECPSDAFAPSTTVVHPSQTSSTDDCDPTEFCSGTDATVPENVDNCVGVTIDVLGQSGKFYVYPTDGNRDSDSAVVVEIDSLKEVDAQGNTVGSQGALSVKHVIESFATQDFTIENPVDDTVSGIDAQKIAFHSPVNTIGNIQFDTYVLKSAGTIGTDTESWNARAEDVKWNIVLSDWLWCGSGNEPRACDAGEYVDIVVKIKGKNDQTNGTSAKTIDLGDNVALELSDRVKIGNNWTAMPDGYPHMTVQQNSAYFHFRFPFFGTETATYDPFMSTSALVDDGTNETVAQNRCLNTNTSTVLPQGTVCRAVVSNCDVEEVCDGVSTECPSDTFAPNTTVCRAAVSICDVEEVCDGASAECPSDAFAPSTTVCRAAVSICDNEEVCDGASAECPSDAFAPSTTVVHPSQTSSTDDCDPTEFCSGTDATVPENVDNCVGVTIDVLGQSGKFYVYPTDGNRDSDSAVVVEIDSLKEVDAQGNTVGSQGALSVKHVIESFATQDFTIENPVDDTVSGIDAQKIAFHSPVNTIGNIQFDTYVLKSAGTIGTDTESWNARAEDVKWNIVLSDWLWCGSGNEPRACDAGEYVDIVVKIKGKNDQTNGTSAKTIDLGDNVALELSDRVKIGNNWTAMPDGYPHMTVQQNSAYFHFRFPFFGTETATYDPFMSTSALVDDGTNEVDATNEDDGTSNTYLYVGIGVGTSLVVVVVAYVLFVKFIRPSGKVDDKKIHGHTGTRNIELA